MRLQSLEGERARGLLDLSEINTARAPRYHIHTFGCQMNVHDSEQLAGELETIGFLPAESEEDADITLLNTCSVRDKADHKLFTKLGRVALIKRSKPELIIGVCGCIAQRDGEAIFKRAPFVNLVLGTRAVERLPILLNELKQVRGQRREGGRVSFLGQADEIEEGSVFVRGSSVIAYVTITEGCNNFCSYCIVPFVRGREVSRPAAKIVAEVRRLSERGYMEIHLLGQNVNSYSDDASGTDFASLLDSVAGVEGIDRIRFITSHPKDFSEAIAEVMARHDNICNAIHLPPQSGSDKILKMMKRHYTRSQYLEKILYLKRYLNNVRLSGDMIVGFPGESEKDFTASLDLVSTVRFSQLFTFIYSPRPGTAAAQLPDDVAREAKVSRLQRLQRLQGEIQLQEHRGMVGRIVQVLIDGDSARGGGQLCGRTEGNIVVNVDGPPELIGKMVPVEITDAGVHSLLGKATNLDL